MAQRDSFINHLYVQLVHFELLEPLYICHSYSGHVDFDPLGQISANIKSSLPSVHCTSIANLTVLLSF